MMKAEYYKEQFECSQRGQADLHKRLLGIHEELRKMMREKKDLEKRMAKIALGGATLQIVYPKRDDRSSK